MDVLSEQFMANSDEHLVRPKLRPIPEDFQYMDVDVIIDSWDYGNRVAPRPAVPLVAWQIDAFERTANYDKERDGARPVHLNDQAFGTLLLQSFLIDPTAQSDFKTLLLKPESEICLDITTADPELLTYPWEACAHANWTSLGLSPPANGIAVVRSPGPYRDKWPAKEPIRILVAGVSAYGMPTPNFDKEYGLIVESLFNAGLEEGLRFEIIPLRETTHQLLRKNVNDYKPHVVHLITHGEDGQHYLEKSDGQPIQIPGSLLANALSVGSESLCLFVSTACMAMQENPNDNAWGLGRLLARIVPITIGMQIVISEEAALAFTQEFYACLGASHPILDAYKFARERIKGERPGSPEWIAPVLYRGTAINVHLFSGDIIAVLLDSFIASLGNHIKGIRQDNYDGELWIGIDKIINEIDARLIDGYQLGEYKLTEEQLPMLNQVVEVVEELGRNVNNIKRFFELSEQVRNKIELADLEFKYDIGSRVSYGFKFIKKLRNILMQWRGFYS